jgi:hypothetical protein
VCINSGVTMFTNSGESVFMSGHNFRKKIAMLHTKLPYCFFFYYYYTTLRDLENLYGSVTRLVSNVSYIEFKEIPSLQTLLTSCH